MKDERERGTSISIGQSIRKHRKILGISQGELGQRLGKTQTSISEMELGKNLKNIEDINSILNVFKNIPYDELFDTGRTSIYISESNNTNLGKYIDELSDVFSPRMTEYEKKAIIVNLILKVFLDNDISEDIRETIKREIEKHSIN